MNTSGQSSKVAVIIVTWNGLQWIEACIRSVLANQVHAEIIVVDNASSDGTPSIIETRFPDVKLIRSQKNLGFGRANNVGIKAAIDAECDYVFLLNQDTTIAADVIGNLLNAWSIGNGVYGIMSPVHLNGAGTDLDAGFSRYIEEDLDEKDRALLLNSTTTQIFSVKFVNAAAWMIKIEVFERVGGFAPLFFHYGEDRDFINRMRYFGLKVGVVSGSRIRHFRDDRNVTVSSWSFSKLKHYFYVGWLSRVTDINRPVIEGWASGFIWVAKESLQAFFNGKIYPIPASVTTFFKIIAAWSVMVTHRKTVREAKPYQFLVD